MTFINPQASTAWQPHQPGRQKYRWRGIEKYSQTLQMTFINPQGQHDTRSAPRGARKIQPRKHQDARILHRSDFNQGRTKGGRVFAKRPRVCDLGRQGLPRSSPRSTRMREPSPGGILTKGGPRAGVCSRRDLEFAIWCAKGSQDPAQEAPGCENPAQEGF